MSQQSAKKRRTPATDVGDLSFSAIARTVPSGAFPDERERNLEQELFGKKGLMDQVDALENELGISKKQREKKANLKYHNRIFSPTSDEDRALLNTLLNDRTRFSIIMWKDSWTVHGDYRVFVIYSENLDAEPLEEDQNQSGAEPTISAE